MDVDSTQYGSGFPVESEPLAGVQAACNGTSQACKVAARGAAPRDTTGMQHRPSCRY